MNEECETPVGSSVRTALWLDLIGWCGAASWMLMMTSPYSIFDVGQVDTLTGSILESAFAFISAVTVIILSLWFGQDQEGLDKVAGITTPLVVLLTVVFPLLPPTPGALAFLFSTMLMGPVMTRQMLVVVREGSGDYRFTRYMTGAVCASVVMVMWGLIHPPDAIAFLVPAAAAILAWIGLQRRPTLPLAAVSARTPKKFAGSWIIIAAIIVISSCLVWFRALLLDLASVGTNPSTIDDVVATLIWRVPTAIGLLVFAVIVDRGYERVGVVASMGLFLIGLIGLLVFARPYPGSVFPLTLAVDLGGIYTMFFFVSFPLHLLDSTRRPMFVAAGGFLFFISYDANKWITIPSAFHHLGPALLLPTTGLTILFVVVYIVFERYRQLTFGDTVQTILLDQREAGADAGSMQNTTQARPDASTSAVNFLTDREIDIALLLIEGNRRDVIARKLRRSTDEISRDIDSMRAKFTGQEDPDPAVSCASHAFNLTRRETDVLRCLTRSMSNPAIAAELFIAEDTVKKHVRSLMSKIPVADRRQVPDWISTFEEQPQPVMSI
ncbi:MAG: helix-turn-helix transcriptional regulator [Propionibacteriaceae bacterium]|nr:helix-turn-helix transcriptional regulator [Propionibacteriaceae bacterium]